METMMTLEHIVKGLGSAGLNSFKDVYKASKAAMTDRAMAVRTAAAKVGQDGVCCEMHQDC